MPPATDRNHSPTVVPNEGWTPCELPVKRLDDCLAEWGVDSIDLMKLDAEGHENAILDGASEVLASGRIRSLFCEFNDYYLRETGGSPQELYNRLIGLGFRDVEGPHVFEADCMINRLFQFEGQPRL